MQSFLHIISIFAISTGMALAQDAPPTPPAQAAEKYLLRFAPKPEEYYKFKLAVNSSATFSGASEQMATLTAMMGGSSMDIVMSTIVKQRILSVNDKGEVLTRHAFGTGTVSVLGQEFPMDEYLKDVTFTTTSSALGALLKMESQGDLEALMQGQMMGGNSMGMGQNSFVIFPEQQMGIGDTWTGNLELPAISPVKSPPLEAQNKLLAVETVDGNTVARIETTFKGEAQMPEAAMQGMTMLGAASKMRMAMSGVSNTLLSLATGVPISSETKMTVKLIPDVAPPKEGEGAAAGTKDQGLTIDVTATVKISSLAVTEDDKKSLADKKGG